MRHDQLHFGAAAAGAQPLLDDIGFFDFLRQEYLPGDAGRLGIELLNEFFNDLCIRFVRCAFQDEILPSDQLARADEENLHAGLTV